MRLLFTLAFLLLPSVLSAQTWLQVPVERNCPPPVKNVQCRRADISVLPIQVTAWNGQLSQDGQTYIIQVREDFSNQTPDGKWAFATPALLAKEGINPKTYPKLPPQTSWLSRAWRYAASWIGPVLAWAASGSDNFDRGGVTTSPIDGTWNNLTNASAYMEIVSDKAQPNNHDIILVSLFTGFTATSNQYAQATIYVVPATGTYGLGGVVVRGSSTDTTFDNMSGYLCYGYSSTSPSTITEVTRVGPGTWDTVGWNTNAWSNGDVLKCTATGSEIDILQNAATVLTTSDSTYTSGQPGIVCQAGYEYDCQIDNFSAGDIISAVARRIGPILIQ